ncbi:MAG: hypothetical protein FJY48_12415, partial [Betaproteobacteria bacterium]|nr:hypothetical protein [Betaproteobacteria bacterium]
IASGVIRNSGEVVATGISKSGGRIVLGASNEIANSGRIDASSIVADGGSVRIDANKVANSNVIDVSSAAPAGKGGEIIITGKDITLNDGAQLNATGHSGGGKILVGGDWQGSGDLRQATTVTMNENATIDASAIQSGDGGKVVLWSDVSNPDAITEVNGAINANGGYLSGNGGNIETSGNRVLIDGIRTSAGARAGRVGLWLIDPFDIMIGTDTTGTPFSSSGTDYTFTSATNSFITASSIISALSSTNVTIQTGLGGTGFGDIIVNSPLNYSASGDRTLTLRAARNIFLNEEIQSTGGRLSFSAVSDFDANSSGDQIRLGANVTTNGGDITLNGESIIFQGTSGQTISTARSGETGGSLNVAGATFLGVSNSGVASSLTINTGGGNVNFSGAVNSAADTVFQRIFDVSADANFDSLAATYGFSQVSGASTQSFYTSQRAFGLFSNQSIDLGFTNLANSSVGLRFKFYAVDSWDGAAGEYFNVKVSSNGGASFVDLFTLRPNFQVTFSNVSGTSSGYSYSATLEQEGSLTGSNRGNFDQFDRRIGIAITTPTVSSVMLRMTGALDGTLVDESWAVNGFTLSNTSQTFSGNSGLAINAGAGNVTFGGAIGATKALSSLSVTGAAVTTASINTGSGTVTINNTANSNIAGVISGSGGLTKAGSGTLSLSGISTYTGPTTVNEGTLRIPSGGAIYCDATCGSGAEFGDIATAITTVNSGATLDLGAWNWAGGLGERHYQANALVINGGTLRYSGASGNAASGSRGLTVGALGATFDSATVGVTWTLTDASGSLPAYRSVFNGNVSFTGDGNISFGHSLTGSNTLTKSGTGTLTLTNTNTNTGTTTISGGTLQLGAGGTTGSLGSGNVFNNGSLTINRSNTYVLPNLISGSGSLINQGTGMTALTNANTYSGGTSLSTGILGAYNNSALGTGTLTAAAGTRLTFGRAVTSVANNFVLNGNVTLDLDTAVDYLIVGGGGGGGAHVGGGGGGGGVLSNTVDPLTDTIMAVVVGAGGTGAINNYGTVTGGTNGSSSSLISGSVNLVALGGGIGSSWTHQTANAGSSSVGSGGGGSFGSAGGGTAGQGFAGGAGVTYTPYGGGGGGGAGGVGGNGFANGNTNTNALGGAGGAGRESSITGTAQFFGGGGGGSIHGENNVFGALGGAGGNGGGGMGAPSTRTDSNSVVIASAGGTNTGGGGGGSGGHLSNIRSVGGNGGSGIVVVRYLGASAGSGGTTTSGTGLASGYTLHSFTNIGSSTLTFNPVAVTLSGSVSGSGGPTVDATAGTIKFTGNSGYTGATSITGGVVQTSNANALGNNSAVSISNIAGARLEALSSVMLGSLAGGGTTGGNVVLSTGADLTVGGNNGSSTYAGVISGASALTKTGTGTFTLTGANTYSGITTISDGTLQLGSGGTTGSIANGNIVNNGTLATNRSNTYLLTNLISGTGVVSKQGSGTTSLTNANTYSGGTTLSTGILGTYNNTALGTGTLTAATGTRLTFGRAVTSVANNFVLNGNVTLDLDTAVDYLIVGGGGGGGAHVGGGGGGGGVLSNTIDPLNDTSVAVVVGAGGRGTLSVPTSPYYTNGTNGGSSSISSSSLSAITALGGGVGSTWQNQAAGGGSGVVSSGGGGSWSAAGVGTSGQGYAGGAGNTAYPLVTGGGGGAGGAGNAGTQTNGSNVNALGGTGGIGLASSITGTASYYGGGGGGGVHGMSYPDFTGAMGGLGGLGGGGNGTPLTTTTSTYTMTATSGTANTGGGGGGAGGWLSQITSRGGDGGSGVVIMRYLGGSAGSGGTTTTGSGTATGYTLHTFTNTGSSTLTLNSVGVTLSGAISGSGGPTVDASGGTIKFTGNSSYTGATSITGGVVQTSNANALGNNSAVSISNIAGTRLEALS